MVKKYVFIKSVQRYDIFLGITKEILGLDLIIFFIVNKASKREGFST